MQLYHGSLHSDIRIVPAVKAVDRHVLTLRWWRNHIELLSVSIEFGLLLGLRLHRGRRLRLTMATSQDEKKWEGAKTDS
jgi:hypothetical protein